VLDLKTIKRGEKIAKWAKGTPEEIAQTNIKRDPFHPLIWQVRQS